jgi:8-oxo-dGTP pyrophosphatase MutT (NUDIX family)
MIVPSSTGLHHHHHHHHRKYIKRSSFGNRNNQNNNNNNTYGGENQHQELICNNCGKYGHLFYICKIPITSIGVIAFRRVEHEIQYLMIRRKDTLGYIDFMRGKFDLKQKQYIMNMLLQMTKNEKNTLFQKYTTVKEKKGTIPHIRERILELINGYTNDLGEFYDLQSLIVESRLYSDWDEPEWGFPKGRRNPQENDYDCAVREFSEETGYSTNVLTNVRNIVPMEETFTGSNYNSYRHKYYLMNISYENSIAAHNFQKSEVSGMGWLPLSTCLEKIRPYNLEKIQVIKNIDECLQKTRMFTMAKI